MASLINCKEISDINITATKDQAISGSVNAVMTIEPIDANYVMAVSNFSYNHNTNNNIYINSSNNSNGYTNGVKLTNTTSDYATDNNIRVDIDLLDTFAPTGNTEIVIDLAGSATHIDNIPYSISGTYDVTSTNATPSSSTSTAYSASLTFLNQTVLFEKTFAATSGNYFETEPTCTLTSVGEYESAYIIEVFNRTYNNDGQLIEISFKVSWIQPRANISGHNIDFVANAIAIPVVPKLITGYKMIKKIIGEKGAIRDIDIYGSDGASFVLSITRSTDNYTYDFSTDTFTSAATNLSDVIDSTGTYNRPDIYIPSSTAGPTFSFSLQGGTSPATNTTENIPTDNTAFTWTIVQFQSNTLTITATSSNVSSYIDNIVYLGNTLKIEGGDDFVDKRGRIFLIKPFIITLEANRNIYFRRDPVFDNDAAFDTLGNNDFTNTLEASNGGTFFDIRGLQITNDGTNEPTIQGIPAIINAGTSAVNSVLDLDNIINRPPSANSGITYTYATSGNTTITMAGTDPDSDDLIFKISTLPSNGVLYEPSDIAFRRPINSVPYQMKTIDTSHSFYGKVVYKHSGGNDTSDSFGFKVNDSFQDSDAAQTINGSLLVSNPNFGIYGIVLGAADDTQSGNANITTAASIGSFSGTVTQTRTSLSLITDSTYDVFGIQLRQNNNVATTVTAFQIQIYSDSARTNLVTQTSAWTGSLSLNSSYQQPWGDLTLSAAGTYFVTFTYTLTGGQGASQEFRSTLS